MRDARDDAVIERYPYPIAATYRVLFTDDCADDNDIRLNRTLLAAEAAARFLGIVILAECRDAAEAHLLPRNALSVRLRAQPSFGSWLYIAARGTQRLCSAGVTPVVSGIHEILFDDAGKPTEVYTALEELRRIRNDYAHHHIIVDRIPAICRRAFSLLRTVTYAFECLQDVSIGFTSIISVKKKRRQPPTFAHRVKSLLGHSEVFIGASHALEETRESNVVIVGCDGAGRHLNVDPLYVYDSENGRAADLFYFDGMKNGYVVYHGCKIGGQLTSELLDTERDEDVKNEIRNLEVLFPVKGRDGKRRT